MSSNFVTREEYDKEMAALLARIDMLAALISRMQRENVPNRVADLEMHQRPLGAVSTQRVPVPRPPGTAPGPVSYPGVC